MAADDPKTYSELAALWPNMPKQVEPFDFNEEDVPAEFRALIPYARIWGIPDDGYRNDVLGQTPAFLRSHMKSVVMSKDDELTPWLAGPDCDNPEAAPAAFHAFVALFIAATSV